MPVDQAVRPTLDVAAVESHRRELHVHCYRMLASFHEAEDAVQDTYLRAWRAQDGFTGEHLRGWLYKIATNVCLDRLRSRGRRPASANGSEIAWLTCYPDELLDQSGPVQDESDRPDHRAVDRETIELAFLVALQVLPARQRAALLARDVLGLTAVETADQLGTSVPAANSAVQRARETMRAHLPSHRTEWSAPPAREDERRLLAAFIDAAQRCDVDAAMAVATEDLRITMPPMPYLYDGRDCLLPLMARAVDLGEWRLVPTAANRSPAAASYLRRPGDAEFRPFKLDVLRVEDGSIAEITTFGPDLFPAFRLATTPASSG